jgi:16S rRNA processing protein RimM
MADKDRILLAQIGAAHGVRGEVRVKSFGADPVGLGAYGDLRSEDGRSFSIERIRPAKEVVVVKFKGVGDRNAAEALNGTRLYVDRASLPDPEEEEFYYADLIGLAALDPDGGTLGTVTAVHDFGAGDILEIAPSRGASLLVPFTREAVPTVDLAAGRLVVILPPETEDEEPSESGDKE